MENTAEVWGELKKDARAAVRRRTWLETGQNGGIQAVNG